VSGITLGEGADNRGAERGRHRWEARLAQFADGVTIENRDGYGGLRHRLAANGPPTWLLDAGMVIGGVVSDRLSARRRRDAPDGRDDGKRLASHAQGR